MFQSISASLERLKTSFSDISSAIAWNIATVDDPHTAPYPKRHEKKFHLILAATDPAKAVKRRCGRR